MKSGNFKRKITVLREDGSMVESDSVSSLPPDTGTESTKNASSSFSSLAKTLSDSTLLSPPGNESTKNASSSFSSLAKTLSDSMLLSPPETKTRNTGNDESSPILMSSLSSSQWNDGNSNSSETKINIVAPSGKLGLVIDDPPAGGGSSSAYVCNIKEESPIKDGIRLGDKIVAINDVDVSNMKAVHVSMYLASKSGLEWRKIMVARENGSTEESGKTSSS
mmetsp:Transcript_10176/g.18573  ORF Transcript_10176/g.18573 Transcript_10176/m.18573 type:complete len:221 (-) Transcript_10176:809-1471(-)